MALQLMEELVERDLEELRQHLRSMTGLVLRALDESMRALRTRDRKLAYSVVLRDNRIDHLESDIDRLCQEFLVRHMPVAGQLRFVLGVLKVNSELERIGDYADAIARRTVSLAAGADLPVPPAFYDLSALVSGMLERAMEAFFSSDVEIAARVLEEDTKADDLNRGIYDGLSHPDRGEQDLTVRFALLGILNRLERVADRAGNIAEDAIYAARGEVRRHVRRNDLRVLFISPADATLGPMAEAIGRRHAPLRVRFASAGLKPRPLDGRMVAFMGRRGFDITRPRAHSLEDVGPMEDYYVVVTLSREVEDACPTRPYGTVQLFWDVDDPSKASGTPEEVEAAYSVVYDQLNAKIADLIGAMVGESPAPEGAP